METWEYSDYYCPCCEERLLTMPCSYCGDEEDSFCECPYCFDTKNIYRCDNCDLSDEEITQSVKDQQRKAR